MTKQLLNTRPIINENGRPLNDKELITQACANIKDYEERTGKPAPMDPKFRDFLFEMDGACETAEEVVAYKNKHIIQKFNYDDIVSNTERMNKKIKGGIL